MPPRFSVDPDMLHRLERGLNPARPAESEVPFTVIGYGEISTVFQVDGSVDVSDGIALLDVLFRGRGALSCRDAADANDDAGHRVGHGLQVCDGPGWGPLDRERQRPRWE